MRIVHDESGEMGRALARVRPTSGSYVTVGVFDGVHRGHQQLIVRMVEAARSTRNLAIAITFAPHPGITLGFEPPPLLTTMEERAELLAALDLDFLIVLPFSPAMARTSATDFVESLTRHLRLAALWGGPDLSLGHRREGTAPFLQRLGAEMGFAVRIVEPLIWQGAPVNSSRVRTALKAGDIAEAKSCLGRPYRLVGQVVHRDESDHRTGLPTARLLPLPDRLVPAGGTYACMAHTEHLGTRPAVGSIATRATATEQQPIIEVHLLDSDSDLPEQTLALDFVAHLRGDRLFLSPDERAKQLHKDIAQARDYLGNAGSCELPVVK
jgi:riboflavin kinase/FMN adenylyltransferase